MDNITNRCSYNQYFRNKKENQIFELEKQVAYGLWIQVIGQLVELNALSGLLQLVEDTNTVGERQILFGVGLRTIGQIMEAISVSYQINETDKTKLIEEQKFAIAGDSLVAIGSAIEVNGGLNVLREEAGKVSLLVP